MTDSNRRRLLGFAGGSRGAFAFFPLHAQDKFPSKPIEVVTHSGVGGGTDITARMMMVHAPGVFKTEFVVVNRTGGSGARGDGLPARAAEGRPHHRAHHADAPAHHPAQQGQVQVRGPGAPRPRHRRSAGADGRQEQPVQERRRTSSQAGKGKALKFGTTHVGSVDHIGSVAVSRAAKHQPPVIVPFRGGGDIVINLVGGNIDCALVNYAEAESQIKSGDIRPLAIFAGSRLKALPNVPTGKEIGVMPAASPRCAASSPRAARRRIASRRSRRAWSRRCRARCSPPTWRAPARRSTAWPARARGRRSSTQFMVEGKQTLEALGLLK